MVLSFLYGIRIVYGHALVGIPISTWLLGFSLFFFLGLALSKRCAELYHVKHNNQVLASRRGYTVEDRRFLETMGMTISFLSVLVFALYLNSHAAEILYKNPLLLGGSCIPLLFWLARLWMLTFQGKMDQDPVLFALKDRTSYIVVFIFFTIVFLAKEGVPWM